MDLFLVMSRIENVVVAVGRKPWICCQIEMKYEKAMESYQQLVASDATRVAAVVKWATLDGAVVLKCSYAANSEAASYGFEGYRPKLTLAEYVESYVIVSIAEIGGESLIKSAQLATKEST